jgi:Serine/threonine protein kinase
MKELSTQALIGTVISDRYEIVSEIGKGIFGTVFKGRHRQMDKPIAIKVLFQQVENDDIGFKRFKQEAQAASGMTHPNIVKIYDFGVFKDGRPYIVMDFIEGENLREILKRETRLPAPRALPIFFQLCDALAHLHRSGFLHRDIKPDNVILHDTRFQKDFATLVDFGIAKRILEPNSKKLTMDGTVVGTPAYMSPEQILGHKLDERSDVYAFGVLMYTVITGVLPIKGENSVETMTMHVNAPPLEFAQACPGIRIPPALQFILKTTLKKRPEERQRSMDQLYCELKACM